MKEKWNFSAAALEAVFHIDAKDARCLHWNIPESSYNISHTLDSLHDFTTNKIQNYP